MSFSANDPAVAVRAGGGWILKPVCDTPALEAGADALAVRAGSGWIVVPSGGVAAGENAVAVAAPGGARVLIPLDCPEEESGDSESGAPPCEGNDAYCSECPCEAALAATYTVSISGFPTTCTVQNFNGTWTVAWASDCVWTYFIDAYHKVSLSLTGAGLWRVNWTVVTSGGAYGYFNGSGTPACSPAAYTWTHAYCYNPYGCTNLCNNIQAHGVVLVGA